MKLIVLWLAVAAMSAVAATSCSIKNRSGDFECVTTNDCASGRTCADGLCISSSSPPTDGGLGNGTDGGTPPGDGSACPDTCTSCQGNTCIVDCNADSTNVLCSQQINCPQGYACDIRCDRRNSCNAQINCQQGVSCKVTCTGQASCHGAIHCGNGTCDVECTADNSCDDVICGNGACSVDCVGLNSCNDEVNCRQSCACDVSCPNGNCNTECPISKVTDSACDLITGDDFDGCTSKRPGCNVCPVNAAP